MLSMAQEKYLWKTVTLEEDHLADATGVLGYWINQYLGIITQPSWGDYVWCCVFTNNNASSLRADFITVTKDNNGTQRQASARNGWTDITTGSARSLYASAGTVINVYKLPK